MKQKASKALFAVVCALLAGAIIYLVGRPREEFDALRPNDVSKKEWAMIVSAFRASAQRNGAVNFFGKIVDEGGQPIPRVKVTCELRFNHISLEDYLYSGDRTPSETLNLTTDSQGEFAVTGRSGIYLDFFDFRKVGYEEDKKTSYLFRFSSNSPEPHLGDRENPELFVMKKVD